MAMSLYSFTLTAVCDNYKYFKNELKSLPETILFDVYVTMYKQIKLCHLCLELCDLDVFARMLKMTANRIMLIKCFQAIMDHESNIIDDLVRGYKIKCDSVKNKTGNLNATIDLGIKLGSFFSDSGWFLESSVVLEQCKLLCLGMPETPVSWKKILNCCHKLLHAEVAYSLSEKAKNTSKLAIETINKLQGAGDPVCYVGIYTQLSNYSFYMSNYNEAVMWSAKSVKSLGQQTSARITIEALSQASKACVVKRELAKAGALIKMAVYLAAETLGTGHPKYSETLLDYGFFLLNSDSMKDSVTVYEKALSLQENIFGTKNLRIALTHEDLAFALYVHEYSSGQFNIARQHAEKAISILTSLLPKDHLMLASAQRVKALILEEIALDHMSTLTGTQNILLVEAEALHKNALKLSLSSFGESNVQTGKHYGNLGRLYQSMKRYKLAEDMHLKAIEIKEKLLGQDDYEVGLSVGHLASLYNYHMKEYRKAEAHYLRSINISLKLFSEQYSGLEYDYRGLIHVYEQLGEIDNVNYYHSTIQRYKMLRDEQNMHKKAPLAFKNAPSSLDRLKMFFDEPLESTSS